MTLALVIMHRLENIERQLEEKESGSVEIKLKRHLVMEFSLVKCIGYNFRVRAIVLQLSPHSMHHYGR